MVYPLVRWFRTYNKLICHVVKRNVIHELLLFWDRNCNHHMRWTFVCNQQFSFDICMRAVLIISHDMVFTIDMFSAHSRYLFSKQLKRWDFFFWEFQKHLFRTWIQFNENPRLRVRNRKTIFQTPVLNNLLWLEFLRLRLHTQLASWVWHSSCTLHCGSIFRNENLT